MDITKRFIQYGLANYSKTGIREAVLGTYDDTPEKGFLSPSDSSLSHGCVRLSNAPKPAYFLLNNSKTWTPEKMDSAMKSGHEKFVRLENPVPAIITYYTSRVEKNGVLNFAGDIYHHDKEMADKMFANPQ